MVIISSKETRVFGWYMYEYFLKEIGVPVNWSLEWFISPKRKWLAT